MKKNFLHRVPLADARKHLSASGHEFVEYFRHGSLSVELYAPKGTDKQTPHSRDEIYVIATGSGIFRLGMRVTPFSRGDVLFVPARVEHRFTRFTRDFSTWVFFYGRAGGERGTVQNKLLSDKRISVMAELKTTKNKASVTQFVQSVRDPERRNECKTLLSLMGRITGAKPAMWGKSIVGFGNYHYKYASGREGDWFLTGFSPRKQNLTVYIMPGLTRYSDLTQKLGKFKTGVSCLYINSLDDIHLPTLKKLITTSVKELRKQS